MSVWAHLIIWICFGGYGYVLIFSQILYLVKDLQKFSPTLFSSTIRCFLHKETGTFFFNKKTRFVIADLN